MKTKNYFISCIFFLCTLLSCSEYFGQRPSGVDLELVELILLHTTRELNSGCGRFPLEPIRGGPDTTQIATNGTRTGFGFARCGSDSEMVRMGFETNNITYTGNGIQGSGTSSRIGSQIDFVTLGGRKDQVIEVNFRLDRSDAFLDVFGNARC